MKIRNFILFSILSLFTYSFLSANPIDSSLARIVAENFYKQNNCVGVKNGISIRVNKTTKSFYLEPNNGGYHNFYIFNANDGTGFIIVAADNCCYPVLGYSDIGNLNLSDMPIQLQEWLNGYEREIEFMVEHNVVSTDDIALAWELLSNGQYTTVRNTQSVSPLIQTTWDQIYPYNTLCPSSNYSAQPYMGHCPTGCTATAMAQIMNYWEYPNSGNGNYSYYDTCSGSVLSANFETLYMWNEMPNNLSSNSTIMQQLAVATLMSHCGISLNTCYGELESSAIPVHVPFSFETYFDYEVDTILLKDLYTSSAWISILKNELDAGRPIFYFGYGPAGGHAFICDGYTTSNYFHFNWGWGGQSDGYFSVSLLNPSTHNYSSNQACFIGIEPSNIITPPGYDLVMNSSISTNNSNYDMGDPIIVSRSIKNSGSSTFSGYIIVTLTNIDDGYTVANSFNYLNLPVNQTNTMSVTFPSSSSFTPGNYIVTLYSATDTSDVNTYRLIRDNGSNQNFAQFTISYSSNIEVYDEFVFSTGESLYSGESATIYTSVLNTATATFSGNVAIALLDINGNIQQMIGQISLSNGLSHNCYSDLTFTGNITVPSGVYLLTVIYQNASSSSWYYAGSSYSNNPIHVSVINTPTPDIYEPNNTANSSYTFTPVFTNDIARFTTSGANLHTVGDKDFYKITLPQGFDYTVYPRLHDMYASDYGIAYSTDCKFSYAVNNTNNWSEEYDDYEFSNGEENPILLSNGGSIYFKIETYDRNELGGYMFEVVCLRQIQPDEYEPNNTVNTAYHLGSINDQYRVISVNANFHETTDMDYYKIFLPIGYNYNVSSILYDSYNSTQYSADAKFAVSTDMSNWSSNYGTQMSNYSVQGNNTLFIRVLPYTNSEVGTYQLSITITRIDTYTPDIYETNNTSSTAYLLATVNSEEYEITANANFHNPSDLDYYKIVLPTGHNYKVHAQLYENTSSSSTYSANGKISVSINGNNWSSFYDNHTPPLNIQNGGNVIIKVQPESETEIGTYALYVKVLRIGETNIKDFDSPEIVVYPNPTNGHLAIAGDSIRLIEVFNIIGEKLIHVDNQNTIDLQALSEGSYLIRITTQAGTVIKRIVKQKGSIN